MYVFFKNNLHNIIIFECFILLQNLAFLLCTMSDAEQLQIRIHLLAILQDFVENIFLKALFITSFLQHSNDEIAFSIGYSD